LSPNHTGYGEKISIYPDGEWETPLGKISVDSEFAAKIAKYLKIERDEIAHISEHSIEVQLPFLQFTKKNFKILPITLAEHSIEQLHHLANAIFETGKSENYAIIASSDFSHYLPFEAAKTRDLAAIKHIENLNFEAFHREVEQKRLSICGFSAITASIMVSKLLMLDHAKLLSYDTSGTASKDYSSVVGYAALAVY
jgi:AmmeMemoRadiSam system protein B